MLVRRAVRSAALLTVPAAALLAVPANAGIPDGWAEPTVVDPLHFALVLVFAPIGLALLISLLTIAPALARGERLLGTEVATEGEWIGGPRSGTNELPAPDGEDSRAGGASGSF
jgi:hypothetical protein